MIYLKPSAIQESSLDLSCCYHVGISGEGRGWASNHNTVGNIANILNTLNKLLNIFFNEFARDFPSEKGVTIKAGDIDMDILARFLPDQLGTRELNSLILNKCTAGTAIFRYRNACPVTIPPTTNASQPERARNNKGSSQFNFLLIIINS